MYIHLQKLKYESLTKLSMQAWSHSLVEKRERYIQFLQCTYKHGFLMPCHNLGINYMILLGMINDNAHKTANFTGVHIAQRTYREKIRPVQLQHHMIIIFSVTEKSNTLNEASYLCS